LSLIYSLQKFENMFPNTYLVVVVALPLIPQCVQAQGILKTVVATDVNLFPYETVQLLNTSVASLSAEDGALLGFPTTQVPTSVECKTFPTDAAWPDDSKWELLNATMGGALIKTSPLAAPCYPGPFSDPDKCDFITSQWTNSTLQ
jgi:hypothetical protein